MPADLPITPATTARAIACLRAGVDAGPAHDMRNARTMAAVAYLERAMPGWQVGQMRKALAMPNETGRHQNCSAAVNAIELAAT